LAISTANRPLFLLVENTGHFTPAGVQNRFGFGAARGYAVAYLIASLLLVALHFYNRGRESESTGIVA